MASGQQIVCQWLVYFSGDQSLNNSDRSILRTRHSHLHIDYQPVTPQSSRGLLVSNRKPWLWRYSTGALSKTVMNIRKTLGPKGDSHDIPLMNHKIVPIHEWYSSYRHMLMKPYPILQPFTSPNDQTRLTEFGCSDGFTTWLLGPAISMVSKPVNHLAWQMVYRFTICHGNHG